jgi:hypothetical protein
LGSIVFAKAVIPHMRKQGRWPNPANIERAAPDGLSWHECLCDHEVGY